MKQTENTTALEQYTVFSIGEQLCALLIEEVVEIIRVLPITEVPGVKNFITGMINLRGSIIPVIDLRKRFGIKASPFQKKTRIIIVHNQGESIGLIVDEVTMVTFIEHESVEPPLELFNTLDKDCFKGFARFNELFIGILNLERVLFPNDDRKEV